MGRKLLTLHTFNYFFTFFFTLGLLTHMEQMRMDPKHQFAAQYVLSRAAAERRERENVLTAAAISAMAQAGGHPFGNLAQVCLA